MLTQIAENGDLSVPQGSTFNPAIILEGADGTPVDLAGFTASCQFRRTVLDRVPLAIFQPALPAVWSALTTYVEYDIISQAGLVYIAKPGPDPINQPNLNKDPANPANSAYWDRLPFGLTVVTDASGKVELLMEKGETALLNFETAFYDLDLTDGTEQVTPLRGRVTLLKEITR